MVPELLERIVNMWLRESWAITCGIDDALLVFDLIDANFGISLLEAIADHAARADRLPEDPWHLVGILLPRLGASVPDSVQVMPAFWTAVYQALGE